MTGPDSHTHTPPGGDIAARDAAALLLGLAGLLERRTVDESVVHPDLHQSMISRLRAVGTELAQTYHLHDLLDRESAPAEGTAKASQLAVLLRHSHPPTESTAVPSTDATAAATTVNDSPAVTTQVLDETGVESFPASDPPSR